MAQARLRPENAPTGWFSHLVADAFGTGFVLVLLPGIALVAGVSYFAATPSVGLPIVAIFGFIILFGALALVTTLFKRLKLDNASEALGLPSGSIRAFIALSLLVLFALISVMLFEALGETIRVDGLTLDAKNEMLKEQVNHVDAVVIHPCATDVPAATPCLPTWSVYLQKSRGTESEILSKQLLILIGTLMTSVVSFYFASKAGEAQTKNIIGALKEAASTGIVKGVPKPDANAAPPSADSSTAAGVGGSSADEDGGRDAATGDACDGQLASPTADEDLPPATGGVAAS